MKYLFKITLAVIVFFECTVFVFIGYRMYLQKKNRANTLGAITVIPVRKENFISSPSAEFQYFYEPLPSTQQEDAPVWLPYKAVYSINSDTLNDRYDYNVEKQSNVFRIITLGDSFTFGHFVSTNDNWTERLEDLLNVQCVVRDKDKIEVINMGERGYDVQYIAHRYNLRGAKYHPDLIIWLESGSGFERLTELYAPLIRKYEQFRYQTEKNELKPEQDYYLVWTKAQEEIMKKYSQEQISEQIHESWLSFFKAKANTKTIIATFSNISSQKKAKLRLWTKGQPNTSLYFEIRDINDQDGALVDGHPNRKGHAIIAEDILSYLKETNLVECSVN